jgi:hypothetical protein
MFFHEMRCGITLTPDRILRFRAIVKIQVEADALAGSNRYALRQSISMVSCASSSACPGAMPPRMKNPLIRGA